MRQNNLLLLVSGVLLILMIMGFVAFNILVSSQIDNSNQRISALESQSGTLQGQMASVSAQVTTLGKDLSTQLSNLNAQLSSINTQLSDALKDLASVKTQMASDEAALKNLQDNITATASDSSSLKSQISSTFQLASNTQTKLSNYDSKISSLETQLASYSSQITTLQSTVSSLNSQLQNYITYGSSSSGTSTAILSSAYTFTQSYGIQTQIASFYASSSGYLTIYGSTTSPNGYIRVSNTGTGAYQDTVFTSSMSSATITVNVGTNTVYFGNNDTSGTYSATFNSITYMRY